MVNRRTEHLQLAIDGGMADTVLLTLANVVAHIRGHQRFHLAAGEVRSSPLHVHPDNGQIGANDSRSWRCNRNGAPSADWPRRDAGQQRSAGTPFILRMGRPLR